MQWKSRTHKCVLWFAKLDFACELHQISRIAYQEVAHQYSYNALDHTQDVLLKICPLTLTVLQSYLLHQLSLQTESLGIDSLSAVQGGRHQLIGFVEPPPLAEELDVYIWRHDAVVAFQIGYHLWVSMEHLGTLQRAQLTVHGMDQLGNRSILIDSVVARAVGEGAVELVVKLAKLAVSSAVPFSAFGVAATELVEVRHW